MGSLVVSRDESFKGSKYGNFDGGIGGKINMSFNWILYLHPLKYLVM